MEYSIKKIYHVIDIYGILYDSKEVNNKYRNIA